MSHYIQPGSIVVAVDGSKHAERALHWAAEQARLENRPLVAVTADEGQSHDVKDEVTRLIREARPDVEARTITAVGDPRPVLVDLSRQAHLLVMGSRGRGTLRSMLLGSVSTAVTKLASCPVVVCRPRRGEDGGQGVLVGADGTRESLPVLEFAFEQASIHGMPLTVVHCIWDVVAAVAGLRTVPVEDLDPTDVDELQVLLAESVAGFAEKYPDVRVTRRVAHGLVDEVLVGRGDKWDLVVVGRHPVNSLSRLVTGSISTAVVERAHTTVAVVPEPPGDES
ncbi:MULTISPECIES: universal stress protein [Nocardioides]|uniref:Universal stress protein n=1 Tax=Nocardioides vastitatis TaxID=2568655 RepID=A0ABW0ZLE0_9ACTN|nr:universal stress protein [Nocardioides sp.]THJ06212.1 universal stress protein [Nocardioides sp.]